jgi:hypothetical protein
MSTRFSKTGTLGVLRPQGALHEAIDIDPHTGLMFRWILSGACSVDVLITHAQLLLLRFRKACVHISDPKMRPC